MGLRKQLREERFKVHLLKRKIKRMEKLIKELENDCNTHYSSYMPMANTNRTKSTDPDLHY